MTEWMKTSSCPASPSFKKETNWCVHERMNGKWSWDWREMNSKRRRRGHGELFAEFYFILFYLFQLGVWEFFFSFPLPPQSWELHSWVLGVLDLRQSSLHRLSDSHTSLPELANVSQLCIQSKETQPTNPIKPQCTELHHPPHNGHGLLLGCCCCSRQASKPKLFCGNTWEREREIYLGVLLYLSILRRSFKRNLSLSSSATLRRLSMILWRSAKPMCLTSTSWWTILLPRNFCRMLVLSRS